MKLQTIIPKRFLHLITVAITTSLLNGCVSLMLNDLENKAITEGDILVRLEVTVDYDLEGRSPYDRPIKKLTTSESFRANINRFRMTHAVGRTSAFGLIIKNHYFFIDDRVPPLGRGDIVDVLYPTRVGPIIPFNVDDPDSEVRRGVGATIVRRVCAAQDKACMSREKDKYNGKLTGVLFGNPAAEGWPGDFSNIQVSPRAKLSSLNHNSNSTTESTK